MKVGGFRDSVISKSLIFQSIQAAMVVPFIEAQRTVLSEEN